MPKLATFYLDDLILAIDVTKVQEIVRPHPLTRLPTAPPAVAGLTNLRGQIVLAIDLRHRLNRPARLDEAAHMNVIVMTDGGIVSLRVDRVGDVVEVPDCAFEPAPAALAASVREIVLGSYQHESGLLLAVDPTRAADLGVAS